jgi:hypothetical protein
MSRNRILAGLGVVAAVLMLSACDPTDSGSQPWNDAPVDKTKFNSGVADGPAFIVSMPDGFSNFAVKCVGGTAFISAYHGSGSYASVSVVPGSTLCK